MPTPRITVLFHDSPTVTAFLNAAPGREFAGDLLVECTPQPALGFVLNLETPANYPGVTGLLGGADIGALAHPTDLLPAPIILAPGSTVSCTAIRAALALLQRPDDRLAAVTLLVPMAVARALGGTLALADRFMIAWDAAAYPHEELLDFARWLASERLCNEENFAGLIPYSTVRLDPKHAGRLRAILTPLATRSPAIRDTVALAAN